MMLKVSGCKKPINPRSTQVGLLKTNNEDMRITHEIRKEQMTDNSSL